MGCEMAMKIGGSAWNTAATNYAAMKRLGMKLTPSQERHLRQDAEYMRVNPKAGPPEGRKYAPKQAELAQRQVLYTRAVDISRSGELSEAQRQQRSTAGKASAAKRRR